MLQALKLISLTLDCDGQITFCNAFFLNLTGWSEREVVGKNWFDLVIPPERRDAYRSSFDRVIQDGTFAVHNEGDILTRTGDLRHISWSNTVLRNPQGDIIGTASIGEDITERRKLEEQLRQSQKMEAVGQLAAGLPMISITFSRQPSDTAICFLRSCRRRDKAATMRSRFSPPRTRHPILRRDFLPSAGNRP